METRLSGWAMVQTVLAAGFVVALAGFAAFYRGPSASSSADLFKPIQDEDVAAVRAALADHADVNLPDADGFYPLQLAVSRGDAEIVRLLIDAGADVRRTDRAGMDALATAVLGNKPAIAQLLLDRGAPLENARRRHSLLGVAVVMSEDLVRLLLRAGANPNERWPGERTPLQCATAAGSDEAVQALLAAGATPEAKPKLEPIASAAPMPPRSGTRMMRAAASPLIPKGLRWPRLTRTQNDPLLAMARPGRAGAMNFPRLNRRWGLPAHREG
jgi:ankyrin repeat protein